MRITLIRCCISKLPKDFSNFPERYIKKQTEFITWQTPNLRNFQKKVWRWRYEPHYDVHRVWSKEFQSENAPGAFHEKVYIEPMRYFYVFRGDRVEILIGKDKGKQGIVNYVVKERNWVCVEGLNLKYKLEGRTKSNPGSLNVQEKPLLVPRDVMLVDPSDKKPTLIEWRYDEDGKQVRVSKRTNRIIPIPLEAFETYDYKTPQTYKEKPKDTITKDLSEITFEPKVKTFEMDIMDQYGIKETRVPYKMYWY